MSPKDDLFAALQCRRPAGAVPIWEIEFQAWDSASGRHVVLGREFESLSPAGQERAMHVNAEILISVCREMHFSALTAPQSYWEQAPGHLAYYVLPGETKYLQFEILKKMAGDEVALFANSGGVMAADYDPDFCDKLFNAPEEVEHFAASLATGGVAAARRFRDLGADAVISSSDIADNSGPFFSRPQMDRFVLPYLDQWARGCKAMGLYTILHSDGQLMPYVDAIANTALDALQAIDPTAGMDMIGTQKLARGRLCLCGNISCATLLLGTPEQVFQDTRTLLETCKEYGGLVLGTSNAVQAEVPMANYRAMIQAWQQYGR